MARRAKDEVVLTGHLRGGAELPVTDGLSYLADYISIVIASWNSWHDLVPCLDSIQRSTWQRVEIVVVDNGSTDGTPELLAANYPTVRIIRNEANLGHTKAINKGVGLARGAFVLILDADTVLDPQCLTLLHDFLATRPDVAAIAPRTFATDGKVQESARNFPGVINGLFGRQSLLTRLFPNNTFSSRYLGRANLHATEPFQVEQIASSCMFFRRTLWDRVGGWDERYFGYWVDSDWCQTLRAHGQTVYCVPAARMVHHESNAHGKRKTAARIWWFHYSVYLYYTKWHCLGRYDPRSIAAGLILLSRAGLKIGINSLSSAVSHRENQLQTRIPADKGERL